MGSDAPDVGTFESTVTATSITSILFIEHLLYAFCDSKQITYTI